MTRVFVSHSSLDRDLVEREIVAPLRQHGVETWYAKDSIETASEWEGRIRQGLKTCDWFLVVLSPHSVASEWVKSEVDWALTERRDRVVPVMVETCDPSDLHLRLRLIQHIDFRQNGEQALDRLLAVWGLDKASQVGSRYEAAQEALAKEEWAAAVEHLDAVLRLDPGHAGAQSALARARRQQSLAEQYAAGLALLRENRWQEALDALRQVRRADGGYKDVTARIAEASAGLAKEEAERLYPRALDTLSREDWAAAAEQLGAVLRLNPSHAEARAALSRAQLQEKLAETYRAGLADLRAGRWPEALKNLRRVRALDRNYRGVSDLIAEADAGLAEEEERQAEAEEREGPEEEPVRQEPPQVDFYRQALEAMNREDWAAAREKLQAARAINPGDEELAERLAEVDRRQRLGEVYKNGLGHFEAERWADALEAFRRVRAESDDYKDVSELTARAEAGLRRLEEQKERERRARLEREEIERQRRAEEEERRREAARQKRAQEEERRKSDLVYEEGEETSPEGHRPKVGLKAVVIASGLFLSLLLIIAAYFMSSGPGSRHDENRVSSQNNTTAAAPSVTPPSELASPNATNAQPQGASPRGAGVNATQVQPESTPRKSDSSARQASTGVEEPPPPPPPTPTPEPPKKTVVAGGVLNGKAISKPQPAYPPIAKAARASGTVTVQILVDESGRVVSATAVSGHPLLQQAAVAAARQARFSPTLLSGQPVKVSGVITYNFVLEGSQ